jgi:arylsulfatase
MSGPLRTLLGSLIAAIVAIFCRISWTSRLGFCRLPTNVTDIPTPTHQNPHRPLNVLILYGDDWRYDSIGVANRNIPIRTPTLDQLSREGIRFTNACVTTSICWVSRATYFTGQYMSRHRTTRLGRPTFYETWYNHSWPSLLQLQQQYYVGHIGKWQFDDSTNFVARSFNFSSVFEGQHEYDNGYRAATRAVDETVRFLNEHSKLNMGRDPASSEYRPFALTIAMYPPKAIQDSSVPADNFQPRSEEYSMYRNMSIPNAFGNDNVSYSRLPYFLNDPIQKTESRRRYENIFIPSNVYQETLQRYYALVTEVDTAFGVIINELKTRGMYDNTLILFTTDNGYFHGEHGLSGKWYPYQESIRVPMIIRDPRMSMEHRGTIKDQFVLNVDLAPTILGAAQIVLPTNHTMQGYDISSLYIVTENASSSSLVVSPENWRTDFFYEHHSMGRTYITSSTAVIQKEYSYMVWPEWNNYELLFNLSQDVHEQFNVINDTAYRTIVQALRTRHAILQEQVQ